MVRLSPGVIVGAARSELTPALRDRSNGLRLELPRRGFRGLAWLLRQPDEAPLFHRAGLPVDVGRLQDAQVDSFSMAFHRLDDGVDERRAQQVRLQSEVDQALMLGVVVVILLLHAGIGQVLDGRVEPMHRAGVAYQLGQLEDRELLGELVEDAVFAGTRWILDAEPPALQRVPNVEEATGLAALAVDGQRLTDCRLHAETVEHRTPHNVVVETRCQPRVAGRLLGGATVNHTLVEVGGTQIPGAAYEVNVVAVMHLREVIEA